MPRWSNANPEHVFREQAFGGTVTATRRFGDYTLPAEIEVGAGAAVAVSPSSGAP